MSHLIGVFLFRMGGGGGGGTPYILKWGLTTPERPTHVLGWGIWIIQYQFPQQIEINHMGNESIMTT